MINIFEKIYEDKIWACGSILSGAGSCPIGAAEYIEFLKQYKDRSVVDLGCGDLSIYDKNIFFNKYVSVDVVDISKYTNLNNIKFIKSDILSFNFEEYDFNLLIIKDVFQHLSNKTIFSILEKLKSINCELIITNDFNQNQNEDCTDGDYRSLNLTQHPFNLSFINRYKWISKVDSRIKETLVCNLFGYNK